MILVVSSHFTALYVAVFRHFLQRLMLLYNMSCVVLTVYVFAKNERKIVVLLKCMKWPECNECKCFVFRFIEMIELT